MASELRIKTQNAIGALRESNDTCSLAMLVDGDTGLVLCKSSEAVISQDQLDELASGTRNQRKNTIASAMLDMSTKSRFLSWTQIGKTSVTSVIHSIGENEDTLVCQFDNLPDRSTLFKSARTVFDLTSNIEAA